MSPTMTMSLVFVLSVTAISITCVVTAGYLALHQRRAWGWFLLVAFLVAGTLLNASRTFWRDGEQFRHVSQSPTSTASTS